MMVLTFVLSQCFIVKLLTKPILLRVKNQLKCKKYFGLLYKDQSMHLLYLIMVESSPITLI